MPTIVNGVPIEEILRYRHGERDFSPETAVALSRVYRYDKPVISDKLKTAISEFEKNALDIGQRRFERTQAGEIRVFIPMPYDMKKTLEYALTHGTAFKLSLDNKIYIYHKPSMRGFYGAYYRLKRYSFDVKFPGVNYYVDEYDILN